MGQGVVPCQLAAVPILRLAAAVCHAEEPAKACQIVRLRTCCDLTDGPDVGFRRELYKISGPGRSRPTWRGIFEALGWQGCRNTTIDKRHRQRWELHGPLRRAHQPTSQAAAIAPATLHTRSVADGNRE